MNNEQPVATRDDLYRIMTAIKILADDMERRSNVHNEALGLRDISIDSLLKSRDEVVNIIEILKQFFAACRDMRAEFEPEQDKDWALSAGQWLVKHVGDMNRADNEDAARIDALSGQVTDLTRKVERLTEAFDNLSNANKTQ